MMEAPENRNTIPAPPPTEREILTTILEQHTALATVVTEMSTSHAALLRAMEDIRKETTGTSKAFHDLKQHLASIVTDVEMMIEQQTPWGAKLGELGAQLQRIEHRFMRLEHDRLVARKLEETRLEEAKDGAE